MSLGRNNFFTNQKTEQQITTLPNVIPENPRFDKEIGHGSSGSVFLGAWCGKKVVIKSLPFEYNEFEDCEKEREMMQALMYWHAPHVIQFLGFGIDVDSYNIVMEFAENGSLGDLIKNAKLFDFSQRYEWARQLTEAVSFLHQHNIVHRDIKSPNILIDKNMQVKLADFGCAKIIDEEIDLVGTPAWMPPEVSNYCIGENKPHTGKTDVFSMAIVIWELVAWKKPYGKIDSIDKLMKDVAKGIREEIPPPPTCPPKLARLIAWGWQQKPEDRPTASELLEELSTDVNTISEKVSRLSF